MNRPGISAIYRWKTWTSGGWKHWWYIAELAAHDAKRRNAYYSTHVGEFDNTVPPTTGWAAKNGKSPVPSLRLATTRMIACAVEGGICKFRGTRNIRYISSGNPESFNEGTFTDWVNCNDNAFGKIYGDPDPGPIKKCYILDPELACDFKRYMAKSLTGYNDVTPFALRGVTVDDCKARCCYSENLYNKTCRSFDYDVRKNTCWLSSAAASKVSFYTSVYKNWDDNWGSHDYYELSDWTMSKCSSGYKPLEIARRRPNLNGGGKLLSKPPSKSVDGCAEMCNLRSGCTAFEFNWAGDEDHSCLTYTGKFAGTSVGGIIEYNREQKTTWVSCGFAPAPTPAPTPIPTNGPNCISCWCDENHRGYWGTYSDCHPTPSIEIPGVTITTITDSNGNPSQTITTPNERQVRFGGAMGFKCSPSAGDRLKFVAHKAKNYETHYGYGTCPQPRNIAVGADICVKFPWFPDPITAGDEKVEMRNHRGAYANGKVNDRKIPGVKKLYSILGWFGEVQFCNRPVFGTSFLTISTAESAAGVSATGRIDWNCELGIMTPGSKITGGMIFITKSWDIARKRGARNNVGVTGKGDGKTESGICDYEGTTSFVLGIHSNATTGGSDFTIGATGRISVSVRGFISAAVEVYGALKIYTAPDREPKFGGEFKFTVKIELGLLSFEVGVWIWYDPEIICANEKTCFKSDDDGEGGWSVKFKATFRATCHCIGGKSKCTTTSPPWCYINREGKGSFCPDIKVGNGGTWSEAACEPTCHCIWNSKCTKNNHPREWCFVNPKGKGAGCTDKTVGNGGTWSERACDPWRWSV
jgi:hypothetical protein